MGGEPESLEVGCRSPHCQERGDFPRQGRAHDSETHRKTDAISRLSENKVDRSIERMPDNRFAASTYMELSETRIAQIAQG